MGWLNYHHLHYFWVVAREGGLAAAGRVLRLSHSTLSSQVSALEDALGEPLFHRVGRRLELTEQGRVVFRYADDIFSMGRELMATVKGGGVARPQRLAVGVADVVPKMVVRRLLEPALKVSPAFRLQCFEDAHPRLLSDLALHALDVVISDAPVPPGASVRAYNHLLGESGLSFFAAPALAKRLRRGFPQSLHDAPMLLPLEQMPLRRSLNQWFERQRVTPVVRAEFEDSALLKAFGADGLGAFCAPTVVESEVARQYRVVVLGRTDEVRERFYAITAERRLKHPGALAIAEAAADGLFERAR